MDKLIIVLIILIILLILIMIFNHHYSKISEINFKLTHSEKSIFNLLSAKNNEISWIINKIEKGLKDSSLFVDYKKNIECELNTYQIDKLLNDTFNIVNKLLEENESLCTNMVKSKIKKINILNVDINTNKLYFNRNNDLFAKMNHGLNKFIIKVTRIKLKNSFEIK